MYVYYNISFITELICIDKIFRSSEDMHEGATAGLVHVNT